MHTSKLTRETPTNDRIITGIPKWLRDRAIATITDFSMICTLRTSAVRPANLNTIIM